MSIGYAMWAEDSCICVPKGRQHPPNPDCPVHGREAIELSEESTEGRVWTILRHYRDASAHWVEDVEGPDTGAEPIEVVEQEKYADLSRMQVLSYQRAERLNGLLNEALEAMERHPPHDYVRQLAQRIRQQLSPEEEK